ncbi:MAG TPA: GGDEF domain-containing protein, partial [Acidimicrobiales bacterium]|nr:GGDEF domain-containing protein [Acidimicrobiales bacterium]
ALSALAGVLILGGAILPCMLFGFAVGNGFNRYLISTAALIGLNLPVVAVILRITNARQAESDSMVRALTRQLTGALDAADAEAAKRTLQVNRQRFESRLANALDMAEGEAEVIEVIERSFEKVMGDSPVELLLADNSHAHLLRMASSSPTGEPPGCGVDSPDRCPAARRAQVQRFSDSGDLDACPKLRNRPQGRMSALCVPVSIMGRTVGVIHATGEPGVAVSEESAEDLATLAKLAGARIGLLRVMAETQLQASTDSLTGLLNRRSFAERVAALRKSHPGLTVAMADLDHFKKLNDTYGHDTGDRALRLFSQVIREGVRSQDVVSRHGGEEFAVAFPSCPAEKAREALDAVRCTLSVAAVAAGLPAFTVSFGIAEDAGGEDLSSLLARADTALFHAKQGGRDRVVVHGEPESATNGFSHPSSDSDLEALMRRQLR